VYVKGLTDVYVGSEMEVYKVMRAGSSSRATSSTSELELTLPRLKMAQWNLQNADMNAESSRSHSIFVIGIHQRNVETGSQKSGNLYLVDLAGSEKVGGSYRRILLRSKLTMLRWARPVRLDKRLKRPRKSTKVYQP
jgi:kinesin family protein 5